MSADVRSFYTELGVELPTRSGAANVQVRCFADAEAHRHGDRNPSCSVNVESGAWHCHACGARGGAYDAALRHGQTGAAAMALLERHGLRERSARPDGVAASPRPVARRETARQGGHASYEDNVTAAVRRLDAAPVALARLTELRGWSADAVRSLGLGVHDDGRVVFPVLDAAGTLAGALFYQPDPAQRNGRAKMRAAPGTPRLPFPPPESVAGDTLYVVEGEPDAVALATLGLPGVALPGAGKRDAEWWPRLAARRQRVVLIADADPAGRALMAEAAAAVAAAGTEARLLDLAPLAEGVTGYDLGDALRECVTDGSPPGMLRQLVEAAAEDAPPLPAPDVERAPAPPAEGRPKLRRLDVARMLSTPPPEVPYVIEPVAVRGTLTMIAGMHGQGKSMLALALATGVGYGAELAGMACKQGTALYVDAENGEHEAHRRLHGLGADPERLAYVEADGFHLGRDLAELEELLKRHSPTLLVLDSLRSLWPGGDEHDSGEVAACINPVRNLVRRHGIAALLLHHAGKGSHDYRGSTALGASVELGFTLARHREDPQARSRRELRCWKCRPAPEPDPRWVALEAKDGRMTIGAADPYTPAPASRTPAQDTLRPAMTRALDAGPLTLATWAQAVDRGPKDGTVRSVRDALVSEGAVSRDGDVYALAPPPELEPEA